jgi:hypothetical protein
MIKTVVIPQHHQFVLNIPPDYVGRKIEILVYALDEIQEERKDAPKKSLSEYCGILSESEYQSLNAHIKQTRAE